MTQFEDSLLFIDGKLVKAKGGRRYPNIGPATGAVIGYAADGAVEDMEAAITAARRAFDQTAWSTDRALRLRCLTQFYEGIKANRDRIAALAKAEAGSPGGCIAGPQCDAPIEASSPSRWRRCKISSSSANCLSPIRWASPAGASSIRRPRASFARSRPGTCPSRSISPNASPALAAGCTVVLKPAPETPWLAAILGEIAAKTDMPPGVFNVVTGIPVELGEMLVIDPRVDMITFTGSTADRPTDHGGGRADHQKGLSRTGRQIGFHRSGRRRFRQGHPDLGLLRALPCRPGCAVSPACWCRATAMRNASAC